MAMLVRKVMLFLVSFLLMASVGFAQPASYIDENNNLIIEKSIMVEAEGRGDTITFRRVVCEKPAQNLETITIHSAAVNASGNKSLQLKILVKGESFTLTSCPTIYSIAERVSKPIEGACFVVPMEVQRLMLKHRESIALSYGPENALYTYEPSNQEKQDLGFMHIWSYENAGIKKRVTGV